MKRVISLAVVAVSLFTISASAQGPAQGPGPAPCPANGDSCVSMKNCGPQMPDPFAGIELTQEQQDQLKALCPTQKPEARPENDPRKQQLENIKGILTADQYVTFLENMILNGQTPGPKADRMRPGRGPKDGKRGGDMPPMPQPPMPQAEE